MYEVIDSIGKIIENNLNYNEASCLIMEHPHSGWRVMEERPTEKQIAFAKAIEHTTLIKIEGPYTKANYRKYISENIDEFHDITNYHKKVNDSINRSMIIEEDESSLYNQVMDDIGQPY